MTLRLLTVLYSLERRLELFGNASFVLDSQNFHVIIRYSNPTKSSLVVFKISGLELLRRAQRIYDAHIHDPSVHESRVVLRESRCRGDAHVPLAVEKVGNRPPGPVLEWVCRENPDYLDLAEDRLEMNPRH